MSDTKPRGFPTLEEAMAEPKRRGGAPPLHARWHTVENGDGSRTIVKREMIDATGRVVASQTLSKDAGTRQLAPESPLIAPLSDTHKPSRETLHRTQVGPGRQR